MILTNFFFETEVLSWHLNYEVWLVGVWDGMGWDGSHRFQCKLNSSHQNPTNYNIWSYSTKMPIMILNVSKWLKYILRYILSESWYLFYKCLDYSWCRQNTKTLPKALRTQALTTLTSNFVSWLGSVSLVGLVWFGRFGLLGLVR